MVAYDVAMADQPNQPAPDVIASLRRAFARAGGTGAPSMPPPDAPPVEQAKALYGRAMTLLDTAQKSADPRAIASALQQAREALKLLGQFTGDLASGTNVQVIFEHPAARAFVGRVVFHCAAILDEHLGPEAARAAKADLAQRIEAERSAAGAAASGAKAPALPSGGG